MEKEPKRLLFSATPLVFLLLITLFYTQLFASNSLPFDKWMQQLANWKVSGNKFNEGVQYQESFKPILRRLVKGEDLSKLETDGFACDSEYYSMVCVASEPSLRIDTKRLTVQMLLNKTAIQDKTATIRPYAWQHSSEILKNTTPVQILHPSIASLPACQYIHAVPAVIFSSSGFRGNLFHEFNEVIIPLFITSRHFKSNVQFILSDYNPSFVSRYAQILSHLSRYQVMNPAKNGSVHCFPAGAVIGLKFHNFLSINISSIVNPGGYSMLNFKQFLRESFNLKEIHVDTRRPKLIFISRVKSRTFLNEKEMVNAMEELGFSVFIARPNQMSNLTIFSELVSSCSVMVGAHGAGLTNELFLPVGAAVVQVVPLGLEWASAFYFGEPARVMGLHYLEYKIQPEESSLIDMYRRDDPVIVDPQSIFAKSYEAGRAMYITGQNLKIDIPRFRKTLIEARQLLERDSLAP
ncbi:protein O-linked-mannose beta-1,4-N-acetylglucosaminyltransferase 2-like [Heracleum sosnowskyi]|uniref:Protein O-linked-mannose beta-1,4-N-acetylglucosaminyltransferase 2-like n=1 Tax=Heracleum sosnowskyi TaxID=360622 RepID=A0AAD8ID37_9APIA|nr:protein O-linked-mannose beta-1,4-N-acetylglucosaminyltransferase 2-like [Heracleum sosnowskyi]